MLQLMKKEILTTAWVHLVALAMGVGLAAVCLFEPDNAVFMAMFTYIMYTHLVFNQCRFAAVNRPDNLLLNSLPVTRRQVVLAKYAYVFLSAVLYAAYLSLLLAALSLFGVRLTMPAHILWVMMAATGVLYHILLMPLSYMSPRYGTWVSMSIYLAILILPQRLGKGNAGPAIAAFLARVGALLNAWTGPALLLVVVIALAAMSIRISQNIYRRAEF